MANPSSRKPQIVFVNLFITPKSVFKKFFVFCVESYLTQMSKIVKYRLIFEFEDQ